MLNAPLSYNFPWHELKDDQYPSVLREYLDWNVNTFVFTGPILTDCIGNPERLDFLRKLIREFGVRFISPHGPYGKTWDLNICDRERRPEMIKGHVRGMQICAELGAKTYTVHVGAGYYYWDKVPQTTLRPLAHQALEALVPEAEKLGIVIAVENSYEAPNSPREVVDLITPFLSSPAIGACYDTGHAHITEPFPGKDPALYASYMEPSWWETGLILEPKHLEIMAPHIVTCHIDDNLGYGDLHAMPYDGTIDWRVLMPKLTSCPRMLEYQTEICFEYGTNWAGDLLAPVGGYSIKRQVQAFDKLFAPYR